MRWKWRNAIVTLLIERLGGASRQQIHRALNPCNAPRDEAAIDAELVELVRLGQLVRPWRGWYELPRRARWRAGCARHGPT